VSLKGVPFLEYKDGTPCTFEKANLSGITFDGVELSGARFANANLSDADFSKALFKGELLTNKNKHEWICVFAGAQNFSDF
jgi:uncharacterized protein YjbI with pentapeptide repeats